MLSTTIMGLGPARSWGAVVLGLMAPAAPAADVAELPITEVTIFKDGHALVLHEGEAATDDRGRVVLDDLPRPILGTFWADASAPGAELRAVRAGRTPVRVQRAPATVAEMIRAGVGRRIRWEDRVAHIEAVLEAPAPEPGPAQPVWNGYQWFMPPAPAPAGGPERSVVLRLDAGGVRVVPIRAFEGVTFLDDPPGDGALQDTVEDERLTLELAWDDGPGDGASVSMMYVQRGLRWIPSYRVTVLDGESVRVELQASVINELADLDGVRAHFVVGAPRFLFGGTPDPIGLQDMLAKLGPHFDADARTAGAFSNMLMGQSTRGMAPMGAAGGAPAAPPQLVGAEREDDLFIYELEGLTLAKGERVIVPLASAVLPYERVYTLGLAPPPPHDAWPSFNAQQRREVALMLERPAADQVLRLTNTSDAPITTAPALIVQGGRAVAQHMLKYTPVGAAVDLKMTAALEIGVEVEESVRSREHNAEHINGSSYSRVEVAGAATLTNGKDVPAAVEVSKHVFGRFGSTAPPAETTELSFFALGPLGIDAGRAWWRWHHWPWWWREHNGASRADWIVRLAPGESATLTWSWTYLSR